MSYTGKYLQIDLSKGSIEINDTDKALVNEFIGGKGLGFALLDKLAPKPNPFGPENPLIFINGPFTGTKIQTSARTTLVTKSPLTNSAQDSHCGGNFGPALKRAGYDYVIVTGKSNSPVYINIVNDKVEILDASTLWGKGIFETTNVLSEKHKGNDTRVATIGQAGENLSKISCIGVDKHRNYGRGGVGGVMGSKNLKAIVVDGNIPVKYHDEEKFNEENKNLTKAILDNDGVKFRRLKGTMKCVRGGQEMEYLPTKNWKKVQYEDFEKISSETAREELNWEDTSCYSCAIRCSKWARWDGHEIEGPEYETTAFFGSGCEVNSIKDVSWANEMCNDLGFDTISAGGTLGFAMECYEKGLVNNWEGIEMSWGNAVAQRQMLEKMATREGVGDTFADGTKVAAQKIGQGSKEFAINIYGMELSGINPLGALTMGVAMSVADFASHTRLWIAEQEFGPEFKLEDIVPTVAEGIDTVNARNSLVICDFVPEGLESLSKVLNAATGGNHTEESLLQLGSKINELSRKYNLRNGRTYEDDILPDRFFNDTSLAGFMRGKKLDKDYFKSIIKDYYKLRTWSEQGIPQ